MLLKITIAILLQGLTLSLLGLSCEATSLGLSVIVEPLADTGGSMVRAHFTAIVPNPCPDFTGVCAQGEDCQPHRTANPFMGNKPQPGWCARQWYKTVSSTFQGTISLGSNTEIYVSMNAGPKVRPNNGKLNQPPYVCLPPPLRARVGCPHHIDLSVRDLDGDVVRCRLANENQGECLNCAPHSFIELNEDKCRVTFNGNAAEGQYFIYLMAEDRSPVPSGTQVTNSEPLSAVPVHLSLNVGALNGRCSDEPLALPGTPQENFVFHILPFQQVKFPVAYISQTESVLEIAVVGPFDLQRADFAVDGTLAGMTISRVRHINNDILPRLLPISFAANTESLQSEPRCVWLDQTKVVPPPLGTELTCEDTEMTLALPLATLTNVNLDELQLNDPECPVTHNSTYLTAQISFTGCGTNVVHAESELIYFNVLQSKSLNTVITRKPILLLPVACRIPAVQATGPQFQIGIPSELETFGAVTVRIDVQVSNLTARRRQEEGSTIKEATIKEATNPGDRFQTLDINVVSSSKASGAQILVSNCIQSETADFAEFQPLVEKGCITSNLIEEIPSTSPNRKTYRITLSTIPGATMYIRCALNLCLPTLPSISCPDLCNATLNDSAVVNSLFTKTYIVESGAVSLLVTTPGPPVTVPIPNTTCPCTSHAPEQASTMAAGVILTTISIFLQNFFLS